MLSHVLAKLGKNRVLLLKETGESEHRVKLARNVFHRQTQRECGEKTPGLSWAEVLFSCPLHRSPGLQNLDTYVLRDPECGRGMQRLLEQ